MAVNNHLLVTDIKDQLYLLSSEADRIRDQLNRIDPCILDRTRKPLSGGSLAGIVRHRLNLLVNSAKSKVRYYDQLQRRHLEITSIIKIQKAAREKLKRNNEYYEATQQYLRTILARYCLSDKELDDTCHNIARMAMRSNTPKFYVSSHKNKPITIRLVTDNHSNKERRIFFIFDRINFGSFKEAFSSIVIVYNWEEKRSYATDSVILKIHDFVNSESRFDEVEKTVMHTYLKHPAISESPLVLINKKDLTVFAQTKYKCDLTDILFSETNIDILCSQWLCRGFSHIAEGIMYMHQHGFVHRDIKLSNIFITYNMQMKIADMGIMTHLNQETTITGTYYYIPTDYLQNNILNPNMLMRQGANIDAFSLCFTLAFSVFKKNLSNLLPRYMELQDNPSKLIRSIIKSRKKFARETHYENGKPVYSERINEHYISVIKKSLIKKISTHRFSKTLISVNPEIENILERENKASFIMLLTQTNDKDFIKNLIENSNYMNEELKKDLLFDIRFSEFALELLADAINGDLKRCDKQPTTVQEIFDRLNNLLQEFSL